MRRPALAFAAAFFLSVPAHALTNYEKIHELFLKGDYAAAERAAGAYLSDPRAKNSDDVLRLQALSLAKLGRGAEARERLRRLERSGLESTARAEAAVSVADSYFQDGLWTSAHASYKRALEKFPEIEEASYVRARLAESAARMPGPSHGVLRQQSVEERPFFTVQVGSFGRERNARALEERLRRGRFDAFTVSEAADGLHRVRVGRLESREEAAALEAKLREKGYPTKILP